MERRPYLSVAQERAPPLVSGRRRTRCAVRRAKTMLAKSALPQSAIAAACGFCDASHLNVIFRRHCGAPPSAFRENK